MLTGDNLQTARIISKDLALDGVKASLLPKEKTEIIKRMLASGKKIMMVGDRYKRCPKSCYCYHWCSYW